MPTLSTPIFNPGVVGLRFHHDNETWKINPAIIVSATEEEGVWSGNDHDTLDNWGIVSGGDNWTGVEFSGDYGHIINRPIGLIMGGANGVLVNGDHDTIDNAGVISSHHGYGVKFWWEATHGVLNNTGSIEGHRAGVLVDTDHDGVTINNHGTIKGGFYDGIKVQTMSGLQTVIINNGEIDAGTTLGAAVHSESGRVYIVNNGTLGGGLEFNPDADDSVFNTGHIYGDVHLGAGDDYFGGSLSTSEVSIFGEAGKDNLIGSAYDDVIDGGRGKDTMTGGLGEDTFRYDSIADSKVGSLRDVIKDYSQADHDHFDFSAIFGTVTPDFFVGTAGFTGANQIRYVLENHAGTANDRTMVYGNVDGDLAPDFQIEVKGFVHFDVMDFLNL